MAKPDGAETSRRITGMARLDVTGALQHLRGLLTVATGLPGKDRKPACGGTSPPGCS
jgi:hypothetical protein